MARPLRIEYPGAVYHVTSRGNARNNIYENDQDRKALLNLLSEVVKMIGTKLWELSLIMFFRKRYRK
jgi:REP element-mobilizing transposase RayT